MCKLKSLGYVRSHQAHGILILVRSHRNHSAGFAKIVQVLDPFAQFFGLGGGLLLPVAGKLQGRLQDCGFEIEPEVLPDQQQGLAYLGLLPVDFVACLAHGLQYGPAATDRVQNGGKRNDGSFP